MTSAEKHLRLAVLSAIDRAVAKTDKGGSEKTELKAPEETAPEERSSRDTDDLPALLPGQKLGDYQVLSVLGSGGMGEVYAGEQPMIGKKVAIKVLKAEVAADPANVQRMLSEARAVNAIRHRGIVDIFNFGNLPDGRPYLVMEYLEGTPLDVMLKKAGALMPTKCGRSCLRAAARPSNTLLSTPSGLSAVFSGNGVMVPISATRATRSEPCRDR